MKSESVYLVEEIHKAFGSERSEVKKCPWIRPSESALKDFKLFKGSCGRLLMSILSFVPSILSFSKITRLLTWVFLLHHLRYTFSDPFLDIPQVEFWCNATST